MARMQLLVGLLLILPQCLLYSFTYADKHHLFEIRMPNAVSHKNDELVCTGKKLDTEESYIVKFTPHATKNTAHHMMVYGCDIPANYNASWVCDVEDGVGSENAVCANGQRQILFAWALDSPEFVFPRGVGLRVGGDSGINYLVIQLHYKEAFAPGVTDNSGYTLTMTRDRPQMQAGMLILVGAGNIPPKQVEFHMETSCVYERNYTIYPIGFRTHAHNLGVVISGYRIREGNWTEIGRMSPQQPEAFNKVGHAGMDIRPGDILAGRCTYNSLARDNVTRTGPTNFDEMCGFYMFYATYDTEDLHTDYCYKNSNKYHWLDEFAEADIPSDASSLDGIAGAAEVIRQKFNINPTVYSNKVVEE